MIALVAVVSYGARFSDSGPAASDIFFRWPTAMATFVLDGLLLLLMLLVARGLPGRDAFALRPPPSWGEAATIAFAALAATWTTSFVLQTVLGEAPREQAVPTYFDASRLGAFLANVLAIVVFVPIVEECTCRGVGFYLLGPWGPATAIVGTSIAFALAHGAVLDLPWVLVTGLGLGYLRSRTGSLYPCVGLHATVNGIAMLASVLLALDPAP